MPECEFQRDASPQGDTKDIRLLHAEHLHQPRRIVSHHFNRIRYVRFICAARTPVIKRQDLIFFCKPANDSIPLGYIGSKPKNHHQWLTVTMHFVIHLYVIYF